MATIHFITRKIAHFTEYAILGLLAARAFRPYRRWFLISAVLIVVYALIDEYHQSFVPSRTASIFDSLIDMSGGLAALIIILKRSRRFSRTNTDLYNQPD